MQARPKRFLVCPLMYDGVLLPLLILEEFVFENCPGSHFGSAGEKTFFHVGPERHSRIVFPINNTIAQIQHNREVPKVCLSFLQMISRDLPMIMN